MIMEENLTTDVFYISSAISPTTGAELSPESCLAELRKGWGERLSRFEMDEDEYLLRYNAYLQSRAGTRITYVRQWLRDNTIRFGEKTEIHALMRRFEGLAKELEAAVVLCGASCSQCGLSCLEQKYHTGSHDCKTLHRCPKLCAFVERHTGEEIPSCSIP
jgi:hypothetical protein